MSLSLAQWLARQKRGTKTRLMYATRLSWSTVCRASRGESVGLRAAMLLSQATGGAVLAEAMSTEVGEMAAEVAPRPKSRRRKGAAA